MSVGKCCVIGIFMSLIETGENNILINSLFYVPCTYYWYIYWIL